MPIYHKHFEQRSAEWYRVRLGIPTASEMDRIITPGGKPSKQAVGYMNRLLAEWVLGEPLEHEQTHWMEWGQDHEAAAVKAFEFQSGLETSEVGFVTLDNGMAGCSPDRLVGECGTLELKCPAPQTQISYLLDESVADEYMIQVQAQLWICEREKSWVASYHPKLTPVILEIPRDEDLISKIACAVNQFCDVLLQKRELLERQYGPFVRKESNLNSEVTAGTL